MEDGSKLYFATKDDLHRGRLLLSEFYNLVHPNSPELEHRIQELIDRYTHLLGDTESGYGMGPMP